MLVASEKYAALYVLLLVITINCVPYSVAILAQGFLVDVSCSPVLGGAELLLGPCSRAARGP